MELYETFNEDNEPIGEAVEFTNGCVVATTLADTASVGFFADRVALEEAIAPAYLVRRHAPHAFESDILTIS